MFPANQHTLLLVHRDAKLMNTQRVRGRSQNMKLMARISNIHHLMEGRMSWMRRKNMRKMLEEEVPLSDEEMEVKYLWPQTPLFLFHTCLASVSS
jgi:hypothetical protein